MGEGRREEEVLTIQVVFHLNLLHAILIRINNDWSYAKMCLSIWFFFSSVTMWFWREWKDVGEQPGGGNGPVWGCVKDVVHGHVLHGCSGTHLNYLGRDTDSKARQLCRQSTFSLAAFPEIDKRSEGKKSGNSMKAAQSLKSHLPFPRCWQPTFCTSDRGPIS